MIDRTSVSSLREACAACAPNAFPAEHAALATGQSRTEAVSATAGEDVTASYHSYRGDDTMVAICVATHRRPQGLRSLLESLAAQHYRNFMVVVVEHDSEPRSREICTELADSHDMAVNYFLQSTGGLPHVRNRALKAVPEDVAWVAFIDDDEVANPNWLQSLVSQAQQSNADIVLGPVIPVYHDEIAPWLRAAGFFDRPRYPSGHRVPHGRTGNALVKRSWFQFITFDESMIDSGGSDTELFRRLTTAGALSVWNDEAEVHEFVPLERGNVLSLRKRQFRYGNTLALVDKLHGRSMVLRSAKGIYLLGSGLLQLLAALPRTREHRLRAQLRIARAMGSLTGVVGFVYRAYRPNL